MDKLNSLGKRVREAREKKYLSREQLAEKVELAPYYLGEIERGTKFPISSSDYEPIASFDEEKLHRFVRKVTLRNWVVTFEFYNGVKVPRDYTNGQHGNIQDWVREHRRRKS